MSERLVLVSNRLPITLSVNASGVHVERSSGGLVTGLLEPHERSNGVWIGWPGALEYDTAPVRRDLTERLRGQGIVPVFLTSSEVKKYYEGFANSVLWPLFHYLTGQVPLRVEGWAEYCAVNERFAETVAEHYRPGDLIWVHDYQLMLVPAVLRRLLPDARIGFFLHIPFPTSELYATLPYREELLRGLLGADVIGFHTERYCRHFMMSVQRALRLKPGTSNLEWEGRHIEVGVFPMGVDANALQARARTDEVNAYVRELKDQRCGRLLLGIDRLDYTKGIPRRLLAYRRLLETRPEWHGRVRLLQIAVPSRSGLRSYRNFRDEVNALVGRINGEFGTPDWVPVHYLYRGVPEPQLLGLYRAADAILVTPIRDGMNLVAKEFVAVRNDEDGVLVLSEFAGAAEELEAALLVNPYDVNALAESYHRALTMDPSERQQRMRSLREVVFARDVQHWVNSFLGALSSSAATTARRTETRQPLVSEVAALPGRPNALAAWETISARLQQAEPVLFLDFDGTLTRLVDDPTAALLAPGMRIVLQKLAYQMKTVIMSGRHLQDLMSRIGIDGLIYGGSHGFDIAGPAGLRHQAAPEFKPLIHRTAQQLSELLSHVPGVLIEEKAFSVAIHYRMVAPGDVSPVISAVDEIARTDARLKRNYGKKVVELGPAVEWDKGRAVQWILDHAARPGALPVYVGDDLTDEDAFMCMGEHGISVVVDAADRPSAASYDLRDPNEVYAFLCRIRSLRWRREARHFGPARSGT